MKCRVIIFLAAFLVMSASSFGQIRFVPDDPYNNYSIGINVGYTTMYGDLKQSNAEPAFILNLAKHMSSAVTVGVELQHGTLSSTQPPQKWTTGLDMTNQFNAINVNGKVSLSQAFHNPKNIVLKTLSSLYVGAGVGLVDNDITKITDKFKTTDLTTIDADIKKSSLAFNVPLNVGLNVYLKNLFGYRGAQFNINYQVNVAFSDYVDGYKFSSQTAHNKYNDGFSILSIGFALYIGHTNEYQ